MTHVQLVIRALFRTLREQLPARLTAADATRRARIECAPGPYQLDAGELVLNGTAVEVGAGLYSAADLALLIETAAVDDLEARDEGGRLVLEDAIPAGEEPSSIEVGSSPLLDALGLSPVEGREDACVIALGAPAPRLVPRRLAWTDDLSTPAIGVFSAREAPLAPIHQGLHRVDVRLELVFPGVVGQPDATVDATLAFLGELAATIATGDGRGPYLVGGDVEGLPITKCLTGALQPEMRTGVMGRKPDATPYGNAFLDLEFEVMDL